MRNKLIICFIAFFVAFFFPSCQKKDTSYTEKGNAMANNMHTDSVIRSNHSDSLLNAINQDIGSVKEEIQYFKKTTADLLASEKVIRSNIKTIFYISLGAFIVSLLTIIVVFVKVRTKADISEISLLSKDLNYIKNAYNKLEFSFKQSENSKKVSSSSKEVMEQNSIAASLEKRLSILENKMEMSVLNSKSPLYGHNDLNVSKLESKQEESVESRYLSSVNKKVEYAQLNNEKYFMDTVSYKLETCVYKIEYLEPNIGAFDLISLDKIQSSNGWQDVIDIEPTGDCTMEEAKDFVTLSLGECRKIDENTWKVTNNLKIKISK